MRSVLFTLAFADMLVSPLLLLIYMRAGVKANELHAAPVGCVKSPAPVAVVAQLSTQPASGT